MVVSSRIGSRVEVGRLLVAEHRRLVVMGRMGHRGPPGRHKLGERSQVVAHTDFVVLCKEASRIRFERVVGSMD